MLWKGEVRLDLHAIYEAQGQSAEGIQTEGDQGEMGGREGDLRDSCDEEIIEKYPLFSCCYSQKPLRSDSCLEEAFCTFFAHSLIVIY